ncbi:DUF4062 domain-containing protein [Blautia schinkii]|nr:DUF4062 domain-containing protein [Blautia schinkii]
MDKKYQIFISSTYTDLMEARVKVRDAILSMYHFPVGMELFGAANEEQWQIISETIDSSDYYVLIIGQRYGSVIPKGLPDAGMSYTEKEFRYALEKGVPILAFLLDDNVAVKPEYVETENRDKLIAFKTAVKTGRLVEWWKTSDDLAQKVTAALYKQITRTKRPGWIRGDAVDIEKSLKALTELTERNQQLAEENKVLLAENQKLKQKPVRKPKLVLAFEGDTPDEEDDPLYKRKENMKTTDDGAVHLKVGSVGTTLIEAEYQPVSKYDFIGELRGKVSNEEIDTYNKLLPSEDKLEKYLSLYRNYHMVVDHGIASVISIHNIGTAKATDVSVTIEFPHQILVLDINEVRKLKEPKAPKKPRNLQDVAYERAHKSEIAMAKAAAQFEQFYDVKALKLPDLSAYTIRNNVFESMDIFDNTVNIEIKSGIVHTKWDSFRDIYIVPMKKGKFRAKVIFMCAEYEGSDEMELTFICE